jgi:hypothetical protein
MASRSSSTTSSYSRHMGSNYSFKADGYAAA